MSKKEQYEARTEQYLPIHKEHNFELVDVEYVKEAGTWYLRAYIDKEGGITVHACCEVINRKLSDWLDEEDFIEESYILEVSLRLGKPFEKRKGFCQKHRQHKALNKQKDYTGVLEAYDKDNCYLRDGRRKVTLYF